MVTDQYSSRVARFAALGDPVRLAIADLLHDGDLSPDTLTASLQIPGNLLAHHLKILTEVGLITRTRSQADGRRTYLHLELDGFDDLLPAASAISTRRVVFVCTENSARSVMAEAIWREVSNVPVSSAGTDPAFRINPRTRTAVRRAGLLLEQREPRDLDEVLKPSDLVVSVCDGVNEKLVNRRNPRLHWSIADPARVGSDAAFAQTFDEIRSRVSVLAPHVQTPIRKKRKSA
ncbi:MAG: ArsR family transcriptional regulator [Actinobacteria bacterium]|nr:MAG: ArsR family transcriptional regulator [Actinomycetota bacterium]